MKKPHAFFSALDALDAAGRSRFEAFIFSPYFNKHEGIRQLVAWALAQNGTRHADVMEAAARHLYGDDPQRHKKLAPLLSQCMRLYEEWLGLEHMKREQEGIPVQLAALEHLRLKGRWKHHDRLTRQTAKKLAAAPVQDLDLLEWQFKVAHEEEQRHARESAFSEDPWLQQKIDRLDAWYAAQALMAGCEIETRRAVLNVDARPPAFVEWLGAADQLPDFLAAQPLVLAWFLVFKTLQRDDESCFREAMDCLAAKHEALERPMLASLYNFLGNFCARQINKGRSRYLSAMFELYRTQLEMGLLTLDGYMSEWQYKNIVATGLLLGQSDWVYRFIHEYRETLPAEVRDNAFTYNLAYYYYATRQLDKVLELLLKVEYRDIRYYVGAKSMLLKTYYELDEGEALRALASSIKQYLKRKDILSQSRRKAFMRFVDLTLRCYNLRQDWQIMHRSDVEKRLRKLHREIGKSAELINPDWLWQKWRELAEQSGFEALVGELSESAG